VTKTAGSVGEGTLGLVRYDTIREDGGSILLRNIGVSTYRTAQYCSTDRSGGVLCVCKNSNFILRVFENKVRGSEGEWRKLHNMELYNHQILLGL
jgi:hypothetical protein